MNMLTVSYYSFYYQHEKITGGSSVEKRTIISLILV